MTKVQEIQHSEMYNIEVDPADMGRVIGRQGRIAKAIRTVAKSAAARSTRKVIVNIGK